jgi:hypothetical protein
MSILKLWQTPRNPFEGTEVPVIMRLAIGERDWSLFDCESEQALDLYLQSQIIE